MTSHFYRASTFTLAAGLILLAAVATGCGGLASILPPTPTATPTPTSTPTPTPIATNTPTPDPLGAISGHMIGRDTGTSIEGAQIILCEVASTDAEFCTLLDKPMAVSDVDGTFEITGIPDGTYVLVYGYPGEILVTADQWDAQVVSYVLLDGSMSLSSAASPFWNNGGTGTVGEVSFSIDPTGIAVLEGGFIGKESGITVSFLEGKFDPMIDVKGGETASVEWEAFGR